LNILKYASLKFDQGNITGTSLYQSVPVCAGMQFR